MRKNVSRKKETFRIYAHFISQFATIVWERAAVGHGQCGKYLEAGEHEDNSRQLCEVENGRLWVRLEKKRGERGAFPQKGEESTCSEKIFCADGSQ